ncbi:MAG: PHB depolymerase family esterase, partial [Gammaproteobacteria bacterium]
MSDRVTKMPGIVTATLPAAGAGAGSTVAGRAESSASAVTCPAVNRPPADCTEHQIDSGGIARHYLMYLPAIAADGHRLPVIFDFHGSGSDPREQMQVSGMADAAERNGFLLLMPMAAIEMPADGFTWNVPPAAGLPDDVRFALDVLEHASRRVSIDSKRVYVTGFSGGARLASEIACAAPGRIAAVGAVGGLRSPPARPHRAVPVIAFHGTGDPINPYAGDGADYWTYGIDSAVHAWVDHNGCAAEPEVSRV